MTEKLNKNDLREDFWIDRFADKVSKSKLVKALFLGGTVASASQLAACVTPPPAEVAPLNEAVLSGVIGQESVDKLSGNSKIIVENSLAYIANKYAEDEKFVSGTEMIYAVGKGTDSFAWYLAGFKNEDGSVGLRVTDYCDSFVRDNENCQNVEKDLLVVEGEGNRLYGFIDENNEQHPILLIDKDGNPMAFDINSSSYAEKVANSNGFVEKIVSIGAMSVQAAAPEATVQATETLPVVKTTVPTSEATETVITQETENTICSECLLPRVIQKDYEGVYEGVVVKFGLAFDKSYIERQPTKVFGKIVDMEINVDDYSEVTNLISKFILRNHYYGWKVDNYESSTSFEEYVSMVKDGGGQYSVNASIDDPSKSRSERMEWKSVNVDPKDQFVYVHSFEPNPLVFSQQVSMWLVKRLDGGLELRASSQMIKTGEKEITYSEHYYSRMWLGALFQNSFNILTTNDNIGLAGESTPQGITTKNVSEEFDKLFMDEYIYTDIGIPPRLPIFDIEFVSEH